jgi:hypothetical protein
LLRELFYDKFLLFRLCAYLICIIDIKGRPLQEFLGVNSFGTASNIASALQREKKSNFPDFKDFGMKQNNGAKKE